MYISLILYLHWTECQPLSFCRPQFVNCASCTSLLYEQIIFYLCICNLNKSWWLCVRCCRAHSPHHHGPSSEGDPGLLQLPRGQPESFTFPHPVHPGAGWASINRTFSFLPKHVGVKVVIYRTSHIVLMFRFFRVSNIFSLLRSQITGMPSLLQRLPQLLRGIQHS